jgi:hypothetical protein
MPETLTLAELFRALFCAPFYLVEPRGAFTAEGLDLCIGTAGMARNLGSLLAGRLAAAQLFARFPDVARDLRARAIARYREAGLWADGPRFPRAGALGHIPDSDLCVDNAILDEALA